MPKKYLIKFFIIFMFFLFCGNNVFGLTNSQSIKQYTPVEKTHSLSKQNNTHINKFLKLAYEKSPPALKLILKTFKKHKNAFTYFVAIIGMFGTFMGLSSTWIIYHLNRKNNDPLVIDRKDTALKYIEVIDSLKDIICLDKLKKLDILIDKVINDTLLHLESDELVNLTVYYCKCTEKISQINLSEIHNRYKKHIKKKNIKLFDSIITSYKKIEVDGQFCESNKVFDSGSLAIKEIFKKQYTEKWKNKVNIILTFVQEIEAAKKILNKDLKK